jgi:hypothetical protein
MDWDNEQICHWSTAVGLGEYVQRYVCQTRHHRERNCLLSAVSLFLLAQSKGCVLSVMVGINQKVESRRKGTSALAVQKKGEVFTVIHLYGTSKIDKQHTL